MLFHTEPVSALRVGNRGRHRTFERGSCREIFDPTAPIANQMVVVPGQFFGEFVTRELVACHDALHDLRRFEHNEVAIGAALREARVRVEDFWQRQRSIGLGQDAEQQATTAGEALVHPPESALGQTHHVVVAAAHPLAS